MMLTALECRSQGLTFASVHDSYWTHASTIDSMSAIIRDTFIALHQSNVLERLDQEVSIPRMLRILFHQLTHFSGTRTVQGLQAPCDPCP
jgi:DNA-directed RNA polymerase